MSKKPKVKYQPSDTELLEWLSDSQCTVRGYNGSRQSALDDGDHERALWNVYNVRIGRGSNGATVREALTAAWRADTMPESKVVVSLEKARAMMLKNGVILGDASELDLERLRRWATGRIGTKTIVAACTTLLNYHERMRNEP